MKKFMLVIPFCLLTVSSFSLQKKDPLKSLKSILSEMKKPAKKKGVTKKNANEPTTQQSNNAPSVQDDSGVGSISKDAVFIEADRFYMFNNGAAVIQRGPLDAMIDSKGNLLVPFGKYEFITPSQSKTGGLFNVTPKGEPGSYLCLNAEGKEVKFPGYEFKKLNEDFQYSIFRNFQYAIFRNDKRQYLYVDKNNKKFTSDDGFGQISEGIGFTSAGGKLSYRLPITLDNKILTKKKYADISPYSDGMAKVRTLNEFGESKYGFIDNTGKEVIPAIYTQEPSDFKSGLAKVFPRDRTEFDYAYINKKGDIVIKHKGKGFTPFSYSGYAFYGNSIMNTSGEIILIKDFLASYGIVTNKPGKDFSFPAQEKDEFVDGHLRFYRPLGGEKNTFGFINLATHKGVAPAFQYIEESYTLVFDPVSKLAYARRYLGRDAAGKEMWREGYINEEGVFVIVKKEAGKW